MGFLKKFIMNLMAYFMLIFLPISVRAYLFWLPGWSGQHRILFLIYTNRLSCCFFGSDFLWFLLSPDALTALAKGIQRERMTW